MVAIVSGNGLGLEGSSLSKLGNRGDIGNSNIGQNNENMFLNAANGNLVLQVTDEFVATRGLDLSILRTYNSQGVINGGDSWHLGIYKTVSLLSGVMNSDGSKIVRTNGDGGRQIYTYDSTQNAYISAVGSGAYDKIAYVPARTSPAVAASWYWTDGDTQRVETYNDQGLIVGSTDKDGATISYTYNVDRLITSITDAAGKKTFLDYAGQNLTDIRIVDDISGKDRTNVWYKYDNLSRLIQV